MAYFKLSLIRTHLSFFLMVLYVFFWFANIIRESSLEGSHTLKVQHGLKLGMVLFITSEVFFFFSFFWAFFHSSLNPITAIGNVWPLKGIELLDPRSVPLLNTIILLSSGVLLTYGHRAVLSGDKDAAIHGLKGTVLLGVIFTLLQVCEYVDAPFSINDGVYGSLFFLCTGFHGFHVLLGTILLTVCFIRVVLDHITDDSHIGFETAAWYWHFVDVVWLFLYVCIYWWGA